MEDILCPKNNLVQDFLHPQNVLLGLGEQVFPPKDSKETKGRPVST